MSSVEAEDSSLEADTCWVEVLGNPGDRLDDLVDRLRLRRKLADRQRHLLRGVAHRIHSRRCRLGLTDSLLGQARAPGQ